MGPVISAVSTAKRKKPLRSRATTDYFTRAKRRRLRILLYARGRLTRTHTPTIGEVGEVEAPSDEKLRKRFILQFAELRRRYASAIRMSITKSETVVST
jgi:hypothetical protein